MSQPPGFEKPGKETWVWKLVHGLYGMKQAGRIWKKTIHARMLEWDFTQLSSESYVYYRQLSSGTIFATVHVDDFLSVAFSRDENEHFKAQMQEVWTISDLGEVCFVVSIAIEWDCTTHSIILSQMALIDCIVSQFGQLDAFPLSLPMVPGLKLQCVATASLSETDQQNLA
jgi:hypothetical protein